MMTFPIYGKIENGNQTTNQHRIVHSFSPIGERGKPMIFFGHLQENYSTFSHKHWVGQTSRPPPRILVLTVPEDLHYVFGGVRS